MDRLLTLLERELKDRELGAASSTAAYLAQLRHFASSASTGASCQARSARALTIVSTEHTSDWNPINPKTYTALFVSRLITERLLEPKCYDFLGESKEMAFRCQSESEGGLEVMPLRLELLNKKCGQALGVAPLSTRDIAFSLKQIEQAPYSEYRDYNISLTQDGILQTGDLDARSSRTSLDKLDFPVLRYRGDESDSIATTLIGVQQRDYINQHTAGPFAIEEMDSSALILKSRDPGVRLHRIRIVELLTGHVDDLLSRKIDIDVVLAVPRGVPYPKERFDAIASEDLRSFAYIGFNFAHPDYKKGGKWREREFFYDQEFRQLFTRSVWSSAVVRGKLSIDGRYEESSGIFLGECFDLPENVQLTVASDLRRQVASYLERQKLGRLQLRMLISPDIEKHLTAAELGGFADELNDVWSQDAGNGLKFEILTSGTAAKFHDTRIRHDYDLIFDELTYGRNVRRLLSFVDPRRVDNENFLGIDVFDTREIDRWLTDRVWGMDEFRRAVSRRYPVAVVGFFPRSNLIARGIARGHWACSRGVPIPFYDIQNWRVQR